MWILSYKHAVNELYMIPYLHFFFAKKALIFWNLLYLFYLKLISPSEIIFTNDKHVFLRILVTNLRVLCFDICAIYPLCVHRVTEVDSILYQKFSLWTYSPFRHDVSLLYFSQNNLLRVLTYGCRHCIKCFSFQYKKKSYFLLIYPHLISKMRRATKPCSRETW